MGIGSRIWEWLNNLDFVSTIRRWVDGYRERLNAVGDGWLAQVTTLLKAGQLGQAALVTIVAVIYVLAGDASFHPQNIVPGHEEATREIDAFKSDPQGYLQEKLHEFGTSPQTKAFTEFVGTIITEPVVSLLEQYAGEENPDPHAMARSFHGIASGLPWAAESFDSVLRAVLGERAPSVGKQIMALYWGLGMGFLGWQTLAPLLSSGLQPNLERYYNRLYRPARFTASQVRDLFALGRFSATDVSNYLKDQGWRDQDIQTWIDLSYRSLSEGTLWELYHKGVITQGQMETRLYEHGYNPADIPLLFKANEKEETEDAPKYLVSTAKAAFKARLISEGEFREVLTDLEYAPREIELQIQLLTTEKEVEARDLSTSQIKSLYNGRIIGKDEAKHNLTEIRYTAEVAEQLIQLWDDENVPKAVRINRGTITEAYTWGVLSRDQAKNMLMSDCGYTSEQAELILKVEDAQSVDEEPIETVSSKALSYALLKQFVQAGLMTRQEFLERPELELLTEADRNALVALYFMVTPDEPPELDESLLAEAYVFGLMSRDQLTNRLIDRGLSAEDTETFVRLVELDNPLVFGEFTTRYIRLPNPSQLQLALQRGLITEEEFRGHLQRQGYSLDAVEIYLFNAQYQAPADPRDLTKADIISLYKTAKISRQNALQRLITLGYTSPDALLLIQKEEQLPEDTEIGQALIADLIDAGNALLLLGEQGFSPDELEAFAARIEQGLV